MVKNNLDLLYDTLRLVPLFPIFGLFYLVHSTGNWWFLLAVTPLWVLGQDLLRILFRRLGYHTAPKERKIGHKHYLPVMVKSSPDYVALYESRSRGYNYLYSLFLMALYAVEGTLALGIFVIFVTVVMAIHPFLFFLIALPYFLLVIMDDWLKAQFPRWFALEVILVESGHPIFRKRST